MHQQKVWRGGFRMVILANASNLAIRILVVVTQAPYNADNIGVLDIATERFETIDISHTTTADMKCLGTKKD